MNERIKKLAEQAELLYEKDSDVYLLEHATGELEKFAELIVRDCAKKCNEFGDRLEDERPNKDLGIVAYECADGIKRMFGVEE